jgi:hypothetical protein
VDSELNFSKEMFSKCNIKKREMIERRDSNLIMTFETNIYSCWRKLFFLPAG